MYNLPLQAMLGASLTVQTIDGNAELSVPPCSQSGIRLRMRGKGVSSMRTGARGDQLVEIRVVLPRSLSPRQRELMLEFGREEANKHSRM